MNAGQLQVTGAAQGSLSAASARLRGVPGFPRAVGRPRKPADAAPAQAPIASAASPEPLKTRTAKPAVTPVSPIGPRLLGVRGLATYLDMSRDLVYELAGGALKPAVVKVPAPADRPRVGTELRRLYFDRVLVDDIVTTWRVPANG
jgi:hypothetical protein